MRTLAVLAFIGGFGALGVYAAQRPTVASGEVLAADLLVGAPGWERLTCDPAPIGVDGATFWCEAHLRDGSAIKMQYKLERDGRLQAVSRPVEVAPARRKRDPWGP